MSTTITFQLVGEGSNLDVTLAKAESRLGKIGEAGKRAGQSTSSGLDGAARSGERASSVFTTMSGNIQRMGQTGLKAGNDVSSGASKGVSGMDKLLKVAVHARAALAAVAGVSLGAAALRSIGELADGYVNITSRIRNVTTSEEALIRVREKSFEIAQRTRTSFEDTVTLYARLTRATATLNTTEAQRLGITETINKAYIVSGATIQEASNSIIQLTQALASGVLRGEEFNSVAEQGPIILDLLSASLGKTRGELRAMAKQGKLTSEVVTKALIDGQGIVDAQFANMAVTIEGAAVRVTNAWQKFIGQSSEASGAGSAIAGALSAVAANMDQIATTALRLAEVIATVFAGRAISSVLEYVNGLRLKIVAQVEDINVTRAQLAAEVELQAARSAGALSNLAAIAESRALIVAKLQESQAKIASAQASLIEARETGAARNIIQSANGKIIYQQAVMARSSNELAALSLREAEARLVVVGATEGQIAAQTALTGAQTAGGAAASGLLNIGKSLFTAMGGWVTVVLALGYAFYSWVTSVQDNEKILAAMESRIQSVHANSLDLLDVYRALLTGEDARKSSLLEMAQAAVKTAEAEQEQIKTHLTLSSAIGNSAFAFAAYSTQFLVSEHRTEALKDKIEELKRAELEKTLASWANSALEFGRTWAVMLGVVQKPLELSNKPLIDPKNLEKTTKELQKQNEKLTEQHIRLTEGTLAAELYAAAQDLGLKSTKEIPEAIQKAITSNAAMLDANNKLQESHSKMPAILHQQEKSIEKLSNKQEKFAEETAKIAGELLGSFGVAQNEYEEGINKSSEAFLKGEASLAQYAKRQEVLEKQLAKTIAQLRKQAVILKNNDLTTQLAEQAGVLSRLSPAQLNYNKGVVEANKLAAEAIELGLSQNEVQDGLIDRMSKLSKIFENEKVVSIVDQFGSKSDYDQLIENIEKTGAALSKAMDPKITAGMQRSLAVMNQQLDERNLSLVSDGVSSLQKFTKEGTAAFTALGIAQDILAYKAAMSSIANQGSGDPYSAFARIAAMIALMASIGIRVGGAGGGFKDSAQARQEKQGTGSVLGDTTAKSESIARATEITAKATSELVGINRGMLRALVALENALSSAAVMLARGAGEADFSGMNLAVASKNPLGIPLPEKMIDPLGILQGKSKITDQGIVIFAAALNDMLTDISIGAYQEVKSKSWVLGGTHTNTGFADVSDEFAKQFQLIIGSIVDTVREGSLALGLLPADIQSALDAFKIEEIKISLKGLDAKEQQEALAAVFSKIFDDLAGSVVPFIGQFQKVGEGLGETLVRVATEVQVMEQIFTQLGIAVDKTDPEKFAQLADGIVQAAGGLENAQKMWSSFFTSFYSEADAAQLYINSTAGARDNQLETLGLKQMSKEEFRTAFLAAMPKLDPESIVEWLRAGELIAGVEDALNSLWDKYNEAFLTTQEQGFARLTEATKQRDTSLGGLGLDSHITNDDFRAKFEAALPKLSTQELAAWLSASQALAAFTKEQEKYTKSLTDVLDEFGLLNNSISDFSKGLDTIQKNEKAAMVAANALAQAQGHSGATAMQVARITRLAADQIMAAFRQLQIQTKDIISQLYGGIPGSLDEVLRRIQEINDAASAASEFGSLGNNFNEAADASDNLFQRWIDGMKSLNDYLDSMLIGDLSALTPEQQMAEVIRQLNTTQQAALGGDATALAALPGLADTYLRMLREQQASGADYNQGFDWVRALLQSVRGTDNPGHEGTGGGGGSGGSSTATLVVSPALQALYEQRDALLAAQENAHRLELATQLATNLVDMARMLRVPILDMIRLQGVSLDELARDLGVNLDNLNAQSVLALGNMANLLGLSLGDLTHGLGIKLEDLGVGLTEITTNLGIDFANLTAANVNSLAGLAGQLGISMTGLLSAMGYNLTILAGGLTSMAGTLGINLSALTVSSTQALAEMARSLGLSLGSVATSLGLDLGTLATHQGLLNQALAATINTLPNAQAEALRPLLAAVEAATTEADANAAIAALQLATNGLPPELRDLLAPYFDNLAPVDTWDDLTYLNDINTKCQGIIDAVNTLGLRMGLDGYAVGTGYVPRTGPALIHQGEAVLPASVNQWLQSNGFPTANSGGGENDTKTMEATMNRMVTELARIGEKVDNAGSKVAASVETFSNKNAKQTENAISTLGSKMNQDRSTRFNGK